MKCRRGFVEILHYVPFYFSWHCCIALRYLASLCFAKSFLLRRSGARGSSTCTDRKSRYTWREEALEEDCRDILSTYQRFVSLPSIQRALALFIRTFNARETCMMSVVRKVASICAAQGDLLPEAVNTCVQAAYGWCWRRAVGVPCVEVLFTCCQ